MTFIGGDFYRRLSRMATRHHTPDIPDASEAILSILRWRDQVTFCV